MKSEFFTKARSILEAIINSLLFRVNPHKFLLEATFRKIRRFYYVSQSILKQKGVDDAELKFSIFNQFFLGLIRANIH